MVIREVKIIIHYMTKLADHIEEEEFVAIELFNITKVVGPSTTKYNHVEQKHQYYVEMFHSPCLINDAKVAQLLINLANPSPNLHEKSRAHQI